MARFNIFDKGLFKTSHDSIIITNYFNKRITDRNNPELKRQISDYININLIKSYVKLKELDKDTYVITFVNGVKLRLSYSDTYICTYKCNQSDENFENTYSCYCVIINKADIVRQLSTTERKILEGIYELKQKGWNMLIPLYFIPISTPNQIDKFNKAYSFNAKSKLIHTGEIAYLEHKCTDTLLYFLNENTTHAVIPSYVEFGLSAFIDPEKLDILYEVTKLTIKPNKIIHVNSLFYDLVELDIQGNIFEKQNIKEITDDYYVYADDYYSYLTEVKKLTLSNQIERLPDDAFKGLLEITQLIKLPSSLKVIGNRTFEKCSNLSQVEFPKTLQTIGSKAFHDCKKLKLVKIPAQTQLATDAFDSSVVIERI